MIHKFIRTPVIFILVLCTLPALAQTDPFSGYSVRHFTDENGLPQNSINDLLFDDAGYLWLGSQVGLIRFNGFSFKLYYPDDKAAMESNILLLGKGHGKSLYFQTSDHNLYNYPGNNSRRLKTMNNAGPEGPWLLNDRKQLFDFTRFLATDLPPAITARRKALFKSLYDRNNSFYVVDSARAYILSGDSLYFYNGQDLIPLDRTNQGSQCLQASQKLYIIEKEKVLSVYDAGKKTAGPSLISGDALKGAHQYRLFSSCNTSHLLVDSRLYRLSATPDGKLSGRFLLDLGFAANISAIEYNKELDLLLVASLTDGFWILRKNQFVSARFPPLLQERLSQHLFGPLALYHDSTILTSRFAFDASGKFTPLDDTISNWQRCLYIDTQQALWGSADNIPRKMTPAMKVLRTFPPLDAPIVDYKQDEKGQLYCLTENSLWRLEADSFRRLFNKGQLSFNGVNASMCLVTPHRFWIANASGLMEYDPDSRQLRSIPELAGDHVRAIHLCKDSSILLGTYGQGYFYFHAGRFNKMPLDRNGFLITAHDFIEDQKGCLWIPCNKGLFKVPKADLDAWCAAPGSELYYYYYGRQDGLRINEFNGGFNASSAITPKGFTALLSMKGMVCFYTDSLRTDFARGNVDISGIEIDGNPGGRPDSIHLSADYNSLLIELSCPFLGNRHNLCLEYSLKGLNESWKEVPEDGIINLSRLAPGNYTLIVRKVNGFGNNNYSYCQWPITVIPHFYQAGWFRILAVLALALLLILLLQLWLKLREKRKTLKRAVTTLETTVAKLQDSEQALLKTNRTREKLISLVIHDLRSPLRFLSLLAGDLHDNQSGMSAEELKDRTYLIKKGTLDVYNFSEDFLLWVTSQKDNFNITQSTLAIKPLLQEIYDFFLDQVEQKGNRIRFEAPDTLYIFSDPHILITIIRNLVDNANKYTQQGDITIRAYEEQTRIIIAVTDTGKGMTPRQIEDFLQNSNNLDEVRSGSQLGHKFVFDLTTRINGAVSIQSRQGAGTTVKLSFPGPGDLTASRT